MSRARLLALAAASALAASAPALAQGVAQRAHPDLNLSGFSGDPAALPDAVAAIEQSSGGRVVAIRYDNIAGAPGFDVVLARGGRVSFARFAKPAAGLAVFTSDSEPRWMLKWPARKDVSIVTHAKVPLGQAVRTGEAAMGGAPAVAAGVAVSATSPLDEVKAYNIVLMKDGRERRVAVDSETGAIISDPRALAGWP